MNKILIPLFDNKADFHFDLDVDTLLRFGHHTLTCLSLANVLLGQYRNSISQDVPNNDCVTEAWSLLIRARH